MKVTQQQLATLHNEVPATNTSDKYSLVKTIDVVNLLKERNFTVSDYQESRVRKEEKKNKMKHYVRMKIDTDGTFDREIVIMNSHDGSSSLKLNFGGFRMVCNNQLVFGDKLLPTEKIYHSMRDPWERIHNYIDLAMSKLEEEADIRKRMEHRWMAAWQIEEFAHKAMQLREDDISKVLDYNSLTIARRPEDVGHDVFKVYNRIQENLIRGDSYRKLGFTYDQDGVATEVFKAAKKLTDHTRIIKVNQDLHSLAMEYL